MSTLSLIIRCRFEDPSTLATVCRGLRSHIPRTMQYDHHVGLEAFRSLGVDARELLTVPSYWQLSACTTREPDVLEVLASTTWERGYPALEALLRLLYESGAKGLLGVYQDWGNQTYEAVTVRGDRVVSLHRVRYAQEIGARVLDYMETVLGKRE